MGSSSSPPLVLLHGFPGSGRDWDGLCALLPGGVQARTPEFAWLRARAPRRLSLRDLVFSTAAGLRAQGGPVDLVGHDWGGAVAWWLAGLFPDLVHSLTICAAPHPAAYAAHFEALEAGGQRDFIHSLLARPDDEPLHLWARGAVAWDRLDRPSKSLISTALERSDPQALRALYRNSLLAPPGPRDEPCPPIHCPTLIVHGAQDSYFPQEVMHASLAHVAGPARFEILDEAGHFFPLTHPGALLGPLQRHCRF